MCGILQEKVYRTRITDLDLLTMPMKNGCCNDDMIQLGTFCSQLLFQFIQKSFIEDITKNNLVSFFPDILYIMNTI